jgi:hypothetical protein
MANRAHKWLDTHYPVSAFKDGKKWNTRAFETFLPVEGSLQHIGLETNGATVRSDFLRTSLQEYAHASKFIRGEIYCTIGSIAGPQLVSAATVNQDSGVVHGILTPQTCKHRSRDILKILTDDPRMRLPPDHVVWKRTAASGGQANGVAARVVLVDTEEARFRLQPAVVNMEFTYSNGETEKLDIPLNIKAVPKDKLTAQGNAMTDFRGERVRKMGMIDSPVGPGLRERYKYEQQKRAAMAADGAGDPLNGFKADLARSITRARIAGISDRRSA